VQCHDHILPTLLPGKNDNKRLFSANAPDTTLAPRDRSALATRDRHRVRRRPDARRDRPRGGVRRGRADPRGHVPSIDDNAVRVGGEIDSRRIHIAGVDIAPIDIAPIDIAPIDIAPIDIAPIDIAPIDIAPIDIAPIDIAPGDIVTHGATARRHVL
jgi:hypothetical protein